MDDEEIRLDKEVINAHGTVKTPLWHKIFFWGSLLIILILVIVGVVYSVTTKAPVPLGTLMDKYWTYTLSQNPDLATLTGSSGYDNVLGKVSFEAYQNQIFEYDSMADELEKLEIPTDINEYLNYEMLNQSIQYAILKLQAAFYRVPFNQLQGPQIDLLVLFQNAPFQTLKNRQDYLARLKDMSRYLNETETLITELRLRGITLPKIIASKVLDQIQSVINGIPTYSSPFYRNCITSPAEGCQEIITTILADVYTAWERLRNYFQEYIPLCRDTISVTEYPFGQFYYETLVEYFTTTDYTAYEIHQIGIDEVMRIREEAEIVAERNNMTFSQYINYLRTNPEFYVDTPEEYLSFIRDACKRADAAMPQLFQVQPRCPYGVYPVPANEEEGSAVAMYRQSDGACTRPGMYFANTFNVTTRPIYTMESTSLHEAVPGHHFQIAIQQEATIPPFRQFGDWNAYIEGWGLYAESLGTMMGFYTEDPFLFGSYSDEMLRACRLVVDTGIHQLNWTRQEAIDFMVNYTATSVEIITIEVDRYIGMPGQALGYKIGQLKISSLRDKIEEIMGDQFDIRLFHSTLIGQGAMPLTLLEEYIYKFYCQQFNLNADICK